MAQLPRQFSFGNKGKRVQLTSSGTYDKNWKKLRDRRITEEPLCRHCLAEHKLTPATQVDHIIPKVEGGQDTWENTQSLCGPCHSQKTASENARRRGIPPLQKV